MLRQLDAITVCGPSGVGKGTLLGRLFKNYPDRFGYSVSHTSRALREGERDGREYHFVDRTTMEQMRDNNEFLELCEVHGNLYGTSLKAVEAVRNTGKICVFEVDVKGAQKIRAKHDVLNTLFVFITPPSIEDLRERIRKRGAETEEVLQRRLCTAHDELQFVKENADFFSHIIVNNNLDTAYEELLRVFNEEFIKHNMPALESHS